MRYLYPGLLAFVFSSAALANEGLWKRLGTEPNLILVMRHMNAGGGPPLAWDKSGNCAGERRHVDQLTMELIDEEDLLVGKTSESGEIEVLGKIRLRP